MLDAKKIHPEEIPIEILEGARVAPYPYTNMPFPNTFSSFLQEGETTYIIPLPIVNACLHFLPKEKKPAYLISKENALTSEYCLSIAKGQNMIAHYRFHWHEERTVIPNKEYGLGRKVIKRSALPFNDFKKKLFKEKEFHTISPPELQALAATVEQTHCPTLISTGLSAELALHYLQNTDPGTAWIVIEEDAFFICAYTDEARAYGPFEFKTPILSNSDTHPLHLFLQHFEEKEGIALKLEAVHLTKDAPYRCEKDYFEETLLLEEEIEDFFKNAHLSYENIKTPTKENYLPSPAKEVMEKAFRIESPITLAGNIHLCAPQDLHHLPLCYLTSPAAPDRLIVIDQPVQPEIIYGPHRPSHFREITRYPLPADVALSIITERVYQLSKDAFQFASLPCPGIDALKSELKENFLLTIKTEEEATSYLSESKSHLIVWLNEKNEVIITSKQVGACASTDLFHKKMALDYLSNDVFIIKEGKLETQSISDYFQAASTACLQGQAIKDPEKSPQPLLSRLDQLLMDTPPSRKRERVSPSSSSIVLQYAALQRPHTPPIEEEEAQNVKKAYQD